MKALLLIDIQNDFLPGGALAVPEGNLIIPLVNDLIAAHSIVIATQDWHPAQHASFAANHPDKSVYEQIDLHGLPQTLWPVHCVQQTGGALFAPGLATSAITRVFPKGTDPQIDSYSGFFDNGRRGDTGLTQWLHDQHITELTVCGLATDYCVKFSVLDALEQGFKVRVVIDACRGVNLQAGDCDRAIEEMRNHGAIIC